MKPLQLKRVTLTDKSSHRGDWVRLRDKLWPEDGLDSLAAQLDRLCALGVNYVAVIAFDEAGAAVGFAEASVRPYANACETLPVVFLEGIFVEPSHRLRGIASQLVADIQAWGRECGCAEMGSDALINNVGSRRFHKAVGFKEAERVVYFSKPI